MRWMVREYPKYKELLSCLKEPSISPVLSHQPKAPAGTISDSTSKLALLQLPPTAQKEYEAVDQAIAKADESVLKMIDLVYWKNTHTVIGAGEAVFLSEAQAKRVHKEFIYSVARNYGLLYPKKNKDDTTEPK